MLRQLVTEAVAGVQPPEPKAVDMDAVKGIVADLVATAVAGIPVPKNGTSVTIDDVMPLIQEAANLAVDALPKPRDGEPGKSVTIDDVAPLIATEVDRAVKALPPAKPGEPGQSVTLEEVAPVIQKAVSEAVAAIPKPKDGEDGISVTVDDVAPLLTELVEKAVSARPVPKDGVGLAGALIDRQGDLIITLTDGTAKSLGRVDGRPGIDGLGFDDLAVEHDGERGVKLKFSRDGVTKEFGLILPAVIYRGVYEEGRAYERGDTVTWGGSLWHANEETSVKPADNNKSWTLAVRKGRDGKSEPVKAIDPTKPVSVK
jgi:hypothetical protein